MDTCFCCLTDFKEGDITTSLPCTHKVHTDCIEGQTSIRCFCGRNSQEEFNRGSREINVTAAVLITVFIAIAFRAVTLP